MMRPTDGQLPAQTGLGLNSQFQLRETSEATRNFEMTMLSLKPMDEFFVPAPADHIKREKAKARELRQSTWWKQVLGKGVCYHCEQRFPAAELTMDHLIPVVRGGKSTKNNCVPSCKDCNSKKGHKTRAELAFEDLPESTEGMSGSSDED